MAIHVFKMRGGVGRDEDGQMNAETMVVRINDGIDYTSGLAAAKEILGGYLVSFLRACWTAGELNFYPLYVDGLPLLTSTAPSTWPVMTSADKVAAFGVTHSGTGSYSQLYKQRKYSKVRIKPDEFEIRLSNSSQLFNACKVANRQPGNSSLQFLTPDGTYTS